MKTANMIRTGGVSAALGIALFVAPAAIASAAPSTQDNTAKQPSAHAAKGFLTGALNRHIAQLQAQDAKVQQQIAADQAKLAQEAQKLAAAKAAEQAAHAAQLAARQREVDAIKGVVAGTSTPAQAIVAVQEAGAAGRDDLQAREVEMDLYVQIALSRAQDFRHVIVDQRYRDQIAHLQTASGIIQK